MTERIIKAPVEVANYIDRVRELADANRSSFSFLPAGVYEDAAMKGGLWIAVDQTKRDLKGYLLFGGTYPHLKVVQIHVLHQFRSVGLARTFIEELRRYGEEKNYLTISARVATELEANRFWQGIGFRIVRQVPGGKKSGRTLNVYLFELDTPSLFRDFQSDATTPAEGVRQIAYPSRPILQTPSYVIDLNVFFDVVRNRDTSESARILSSAFDNEIKLHVTSEFVRELERHSQDFENDPVLEFANGLPALPELSPDTLEPLTEEIRNILAPNTTKSGEESQNAESDRIHLASCIHHRAYGFVTRDAAILGTDQNAVIHLYTHELGLSRGTQCSGSGGVQVTRGRGSARGLVQCRRGRTAEQREPVVDPLSGQALASTGPLVPSPAPRAQIEPGTEQVEKALGCTFVHIEIGA